MTANGEVASGTAAQEAPGRAPLKPHGPVSIELAETLADECYRIDRYSVSHHLKSQTDVPGPSRFPRLVCGRGDRVAVLPYRRSDRSLVLVRQFRLPVLLAEPEGDGLSIEAPGGLIGSDSPEAAAQREVMEETGLAVSELRPALVVFCHPVFVKERTFLFLAPMDDLVPTSAGGGIPSEGEDIEVMQITLKVALDMVADHVISDAKTVMALYHLARQS